MLTPRCNELLDQLTDSDSRLIFHNLRLVSLTEGQELYAPGDLIDQVYFPVTALLAIAKEMKDGLSIDIALIGKEGGAGFRGMVSRCPNWVYVSASGLAYQISLQQLEQIQANQLNQRGNQQPDKSSAWLIGMYMQATKTVFDSIAIETACAHFHTTSERLARWLLTRHKRMKSNYIEATHQKIADSLGVRREAITNALLKLKGIDYCRNQIEVTDFVELENQTCECYRALSESRSHQLSLQFHSHF